MDETQILKVVYEQFFFY